MELTVSDKECEKILKVALKSEEVKLINHEMIVNSPDGFNGLYFTLCIDYKSNNNTKDIKNLSCFMKSVPRGEREFWYIEGTKLLLKENEMYEVLIPTMQNLIDVKIPVPECYYIRFVPENQFNNIVVLENLKEKGYIMRNPREEMNYEECSLVMQAFAKLHAGSIIFEQKERRPILELCKYPDEALWTTDPENPSYPWRQSSIDTLIEVAAKHERFAPRLSSVESQSKLTTAYADVIKLLQPSTKYCNAICHGDIWSNNLMFKYINNIVSDAIIIDLQVYRYAPPITDVLMFIYLNTTRQFRYKNKKKLITEYSNNLKRIVETAGCTLPAELTLEGLDDLESEFLLFAYVCASGYVPMGQLPPEARVKKSQEIIVTEGARDFDVLYDFLNSRSEQVLQGMQIDANFCSRIEDALDELLTYIGL